MDQVTRQTSIGALLEAHPEATEVLERHGLHCMGCPLAELGNIETGASLHNLDADELVAEINAFLAAQRSSPNKP